MQTVFFLPHFALLYGRASFSVLCLTEEGSYLLMLHTHSQNTPLELFLALCANTLIIIVSVHKDQTMCVCRAEEGGGRANQCTAQSSALIYIVIFHLLLQIKKE